jgi:cytochrome c
MMTALSALAVGACRQDMHDQPNYGPLEESIFFANGAASRPLIEGTVARGHLGEDVGYQTGLEADGSFVAEFPMAVDMALLERGRTRYEAFCAPCHDRVGSGRGMIVRRGYKQPNSFHDQRLRETQPGYFVNVMTNGFGQMSSYAAQIKPADRWAIAAYVQALQLSQRAPEAALSDDDRERLAGEPGAAAEPAEEHGADGDHS